MAFLVVGGLATAAPAAPPARRAASRQPSEARPRAELEALQRSVEAAVNRVARPAAAQRGASRAYALPGYGAVIILAPRAVTTRVVVRTPDPLDGLGEARRALEEGLAGAQSAEVRRHIEKSLERLRASERELRRRQPRPPGGFQLHLGDEGELPPGIDFENLEEMLQAQLAAQVEALRELERRHHEFTASRQQEVTAQLEALQIHAEELRRDAERVREQAERRVRKRMAHSPRAVRPSEAAPPAEPAAPSAPAPAVPPAVPVPEAVVVPPLPPAIPEPSDMALLAPEAPPPPPWAYWFEYETKTPLVKGGPPAETIARVRAALAAGLEAHRGALRSLRSEDSVGVAVDFVSGAGLAGRPSRTLVARVKVKDILDRREGRLSAEEFRRRLAYEEY